MAIEPDKKLIKARRQTLPGEDVSLAAGLSICGALIGYFPLYSGIVAAWAVALFQVLSYLFFGMGFLGALVGVGKTFQSKFFSYAGPAIFFGILAYGLHTWANVSGDIVALVLRVIVLLFTCLGVLMLVSGIPHLIVKTDTEKAATTTTTVEDKNNNDTKEKTNNIEHVAKIAVAVITLLTAFAPLIKVVFKIP